MRRSTLPKWLFIVFCLLLTLPLLAQDATPNPSGGGLDPITTPAPLPTMQPYILPGGLVREEGVTAELYFNALAQGTTGLVRVYGASTAGSPVVGVRARWLNELLDFWAGSNDYFYGLLSVGMEQRAIPDNELSFFLTYADGTRSALNTTVDIGLGSFIAQNVTLPGDKTYLLDIETERNELSRLESVSSTITLEHLWDATGFALPISANLTSPFGAFRTFNGSLNTRHTGWDIRTTGGQPVMASAAGMVAYTGQLEIRGNYIMVDHGYGVFTGYAHLEGITVERGDSVIKGQVLGLVGDSGRTSGPHFHWEVTVNGEWVDSVQFLQMWQP